MPPLLAFSHELKKINHVLFVNSKNVLNFLYICICIFNGYHLHKGVVVIYLQLGIL